MAIVNEMPVELGDDNLASRTTILKGMSILSFLGFLVTVYMALVYAGTDVTQGEVQRIFYLHVSSFSGASIGFAAAVIGGIAYLRTKSVRWDALSLAGIEVGLMFSVITLITGMVWARPIWNTWWTWDPRLTSAAIMVLTYAAYLMLRGGFESPERKRAFAAVYGILAMSTVIFTFVIIRIRPDTIHPTVIGPSANNAQGSFEMAANMGATLGISSIVFCCLIVPTLIWWRIRLENASQNAEKLKVRVFEN
jgi:heme exporter protein C